MLRKLMGKIFRISLATKRNVGALLTASLIVTTCCNFTYATQNVVTIADADRTPVQIKTADTNVGKILSKQGIVLHEGDELNYDLADNIQTDAVIKIYRAVDVTVTAMGETQVYRTARTTVQGVLEEMGITADEDDQVTPSLDTEVSEGMKIVAVLYDQHEVTVQEELAYTTTEIENFDLAPGERNVIQAGQKGIIEYVYEIQYKDGVELSRTLVRENKLSDPVEEIVEYCPDSVWELGVVPANRPTNYKRVETFQATAYDASPMDNGIWAGKTSTGMPLVYGVIAVDPRVIPYGTKMYIESVDGKYKYGYAIAGDCGGAIKGKKVDLFFPSRSTCYQFGRRAVNIYFLD
ncbi:MAG: G5 domain-containing protein [Clostridia bacterium]|nr:G5 domain-containing protein [Clostridia bacterium]